jgi:hypothetical protein
MPQSALYVVATGAHAIIAVWALVATFRLRQRGRHRGAAVSLAIAISSALFAGLEVDWIVSAWGSTLHPVSDVLWSIFDFVNAAVYGLTLYYIHAVHCEEVGCPVQRSEEE